MEQPLLSQGIVLTPSTIEQETVGGLMEAIFSLQGKPIELHVNGDGGDSASGFALADWLRQYPQVSGVLVGNASSAHATVFAACAKRFVSPASSLCVHRVHIEVPRELNCRDLRAAAERLEQQDALSCQIYAAASNRSASWWMEQLDYAEHYLKYFTAAELIQIGMAQPWRKP